LSLDSFDLLVMKGSLVIYPLLLTVSVIFGTFAAGEEGNADRLIEKRRGADVPENRAAHTQ